jgi:hypothetical protein
MRSIGDGDPGPVDTDAAGRSRSLGALSASPPQADRAIRKQAILIFCLLLFCYSYIHQRPGWNQNSRLDLLHAIFVHKTLKIDAYHENTGDKSIHNGHYYSDKAPGIVALALPAFALSAGILRVLDIDIDSPKGWLISDWFTTALSVGLITALGGVCMFLFLCKLVPRPYAFPTTLAVFIGSTPFPYATMLFSHAAVIGLICVALWAIVDDDFLIGHLADQAKIPNPKSEIETALNWRQRHILAGLCCGFAIAAEFPAAIAAGGILVLALLTGFKRGVLLALAAIPPLLLIPAYNWACFGGPLAFGYHNLALTEFQDMNSGLFGITFPPKASAAYLILLSPERGLLFWTPLFVIAFLGLGILWRVSPRLCGVALFVLVVQTVAISGYYMPGGGASLGPRHLAPMIAFLALPTACAAPRLGRLISFPVCFSIFLTGLATCITAMPSANLDVSMLFLYLHCLKYGWLATNVGQLVGVGSQLSILPICAIWAVIIAFSCRSITMSEFYNSIPTGPGKQLH